LKIKENIDNQIGEIILIFLGINYSHI
jgi:hypothetical protein